MELKASRHQVGIERHTGPHRCIRQQSVSVETEPKPLIVHEQPPRLVQPELGSRLQRETPIVVNLELGDRGVMISQYEYMRNARPRIGLKAALLGKAIDGSKYDRAKIDGE